MYNIALEVWLCSENASLPLYQPNNNKVFMILHEQVREMCLKN